MAVDAESDEDSLRTTENRVSMTFVLVLHLLKLTKEEEPKGLLMSDSIRRFNGESCKEAFEGEEVFLCASIVSIVQI